MFDLLYELAQSKNINMTIYVDDIVMSGIGACGELIPKCKRILKNHGLNGHKISLYKAGDVRIITGVAVHQNNLSIPNKRYRKIRALQEEIEKSTDPIELKRYKNAILGQLREGSTLDPSLTRLSISIERS